MSEFSDAQDLLAANFHIELRLSFGLRLSTEQVRFRCHLLRQIEVQNSSTYLSTRESKCKLEISGELGCSAAEFWRCSLMLIAGAGMARRAGLRRDFPRKNHYSAAPQQAEQ